MKSLIIIFLSLITHNVFSQTENIKPYNYKTTNGKIVIIEIDTIKYKPEFYGDFLYKLYNKEIDASIYISEKKININDTIKEFKHAKKEGEFTDLGFVNNERTVTLKAIKIEKDKQYVVFSYLKIILPDQLINFTVYIPEINFTLYEKNFIKYAKSTKFKP